MTPEVSARTMAYLNPEHGRAMPDKSKEKPALPHTHLQGICLDIRQVRGMLARAEG